MVSRNEAKYVIWPIYFDNKISRLNGRKVSKKDAVEKPSLEDINKAAKSLGLNPEIQEDVSYPGRFWKKEGRILVDKKQSKGKILRNIASKLK
jgi:signal recognition particle subunit SRP19